jgi:hypothetical protein
MLQTQHSFTHYIMDTGVAIIIIFHMLPSWL